jgi:hypothetical protein
MTNADHVYITSVQPQHVAGEFNMAGTISGFIITDKPVVSMYPQSIPVAGPGDSILLSAYAIGVPPLSCQWRLNGTALPGATNLSYAISNVTLAGGGNYELVVTNAYGAATSRVSTVTVDRIMQGPPASNFIYDSNPANPQNNGTNMEATWVASVSDGALTRTGVMSFVVGDFVGGTNGISVPDSTGFDAPTGTITFWMRSAGTATTAGGTDGALFSRSLGSSSNNFVLLQTDGSPGNLLLQVGQDGSYNTFTSKAGVSDNKWHFVALTFDNTVDGGVTLYLDGALDTSSPNPAGWSWATGQPLEFGFSSDPSWRGYNGWLDDVRYYSAVLNAVQLATIQTTGALVDTTDLQMQFNFTAAPGTGVVLLTWKENSAVLQSAASLDGPWADMPQASSPYAIVPGAPQQYFRYRYVPQSLVSNPYMM